MTDFKFTLKNKAQAARSGILNTAHGEIRTPAFMPVGTAATVKSMQTDDVSSTGADIILGNAYHLMLRPTAELIHKMGGLHKFMNWSKPILTDSGGFQVMSLSKIRTINEDGVIFSSHIDGSKHSMSPERSIEIQHLLGSDITMCFDECTHYPISYSLAKQSMELSMRWAERSLKSFEKRDGYGIFGIVQGSVYEDLRLESAKTLTNLNFDGYAIGGLAVGEGQEIMLKVISMTICELPEEKPRYLMGVGKPDDILQAVRLGVDMFDCVIPTRSGRNGQAFVPTGTINIRNAKYKDDPNPIDSNCECGACKSYSRAYIHHLVKAKEILGSTLMTWHNIQFYQDMMNRIRYHINENNHLPETVAELF